MGAPGRAPSVGGLPCRSGECSGGADVGRLSWRRMVLSCFLARVEQIRAVRGIARSAGSLQRSNEKTVMVCGMPCHAQAYAHSEAVIIYPSDDTTGRSSVNFTSFRGTTGSSKCWVGIGPGSVQTHPHNPPPLVCSAINRISTTEHLPLGHGGAAREALLSERSRAPSRACS